MNDRFLANDPEALAVLDDLVRTARADRPGNRSMQRAMVALGLGAATATVASSAAATTSAAVGTTAAVAGKSIGAGLTVVSMAKAVTLGVVVGAVALGTAASTGMLARGSGEQTPSADVAVSDPPHKKAPSPKAVATMASPVAPLSEDDETQAPAKETPGSLAPAAKRAPSGAARGAAPSPVVGEPESTAPETPAPAPEKTLAGEVRMLETAKAQISAGTPAAAVETLDCYRQDYPDGRLALEAEVLRIEGLFRSGRSATAIGRANKFLAANPQSPLASRVRAMVRDTPGAQ